MFKGETVERSVVYYKMTFKTRKGSSLEKCPAEMNSCVLECNCLTKNSLHRHNRNVQVEWLLPHTWIWKRAREIQARFSLHLLNNICLSVWIHINLNINLHICSFINLYIYLYNNFSKSLRKKSYIICYLSVCACGNVCMRIYRNVYLFLKM